MNEQDFEKQDEFLKETLGKMQREKVPESILKNFDSDVRKRILSSHQTPLALMGIAAFGILLLILGLVFWQWKMRSNPIVEMKSEVTLPQKAPQTESEILEEIAALSEMGLWDEKDDESVGIDMDANIQELAVLLETELSLGSASMST